MAAQNGAAAVAPKLAGQSGAPAAAPAPAAAAAPQAGAKPSQPEDGRFRPVLRLPCQLTVDLPVPDFRISDLLKLRPGSLIDAHWRVGHDLPLRLNGNLIGWSKIEVVGNRLAVRLTELA